jgi:PST family polysaccharide transporter
MSQMLLRWIPGALRARLQSGGARLQVLTNTAWLFGDRVVRMGFGMIVGVWIARYMGPSQFGSFAYVQAVIALFMAFSTLGLDQIVIRDIIKVREAKGRILGTTMALRLGGACVALAASVLMVMITRPGDRLVLAMAAVMGSATLFQVFDTIDLWFQSQVQSKYSVMAKNGAFIILALAKIALILAQASIMAFAWATLAEAALAAWFLVRAYAMRREDMGDWQVDRQLAKCLLKDGWPLILAGLTVMVYMRIDQIMLGQMGGNETVGIFTAASRLSEAWYFVPVALVSSFMPGLIATRQIDVVQYYHKLLFFCKLNVALAMVIVLPVAIFSKQIVVFLYGSAYQSSGPILAIHIWGAVFVFLGMAQHPWFIAENHTKRALARTLGGVIVNVSLNLVLIPRWGGPGAAMASVAAQITSNILMNYFDRRTRPLFWIVVKSFNVFSGWDYNVHN